MVKGQKKTQKDKVETDRKNSMHQEINNLQISENDLNLFFTGIHLGIPKPPTKRQAANFKIPDTDLKFANDTIEIYTKLPGIEQRDITLSLNKDTYNIKCKNKNLAYFTEIKLPVSIVPQSALSYFKNEILFLRVMKMKETNYWDGIKKMETLESELRETKERLSKFQEQYHAIQLEYQNILVRGKKDVETRIDNYKISVIEKILKNIDNFEIALKSIDNSKNKNNEQIVIGINLILGDLMNILKEEGVTEIPSKGLILDPNQHEVIDFIETDEHSENTILKEYQKGYKYKNRIIRPSKVKVSKLPNKDTSDKRSKKKNEYEI
jgi:molecular chaperone GrpE